MFQHFLRAPTASYFKLPRADLDAEIDRTRANSILEAIDDALFQAENEQRALRQRLDDALARAAVTLGNGTNEYLERDARDTHHQNLLSIEISNAERRLNELADTTAHFQSLKAAMLTRFPDLSAR
jgi:predicted  nucleic acid-binding Zn-ribbon protein